jgi:DNA repair protein RadD
MKILRSYQQEVVNKIKKRLKETCNPLLVNASVGAGKSIILCELLLTIEKCGFRGICFTMNSTLILQNAETYTEQGGNCGICCASLNRKETDKPIIFATPKSFLNDKYIKKLAFNLIIIDECHNIDYQNEKSMYMRVINHLNQQAYNQRQRMRIIGLTGTPFRSENISIVGENQLFKETVATISMTELIDSKFLVPPVFDISTIGSFDFNKLKSVMGSFNKRDLEEIISSKERLTGKIMHQIVSFVQNGRNGAFIFCATRKHCEEAFVSLPDGLAAIITGETSHEERKYILNEARNLRIRYLVSVNCLMTGVDVPAFDVCAWLRPTASLTLFMQGIGRGLRLHSLKKDCLILDYAQNIEKHYDWDDPILISALKKLDKDKPMVFECPECHEPAGEHTRRCVGIKDKVRCKHYFSFKECQHCDTKNDITARYCRECFGEIVNPNDKLSPIKNSTIAKIVSAKYRVNLNKILIASYVVNIPNKGDKTITEWYSTNTKKCRDIFYAKFVKKQVYDASKYYMHLDKIKWLESLIKNIETPTHLALSDDLKIRNKIFQDK